MKAVYYDKAGSFLSFDVEFAFRSNSNDDADRFSAKTSIVQIYLEV